MTPPRSSAVFWIAGVLSAVVMVCATVLVVTGNMTSTGWTGVLTGLVTPIIMTILGIQNSQQSVQIDLINEHERADTPCGIADFEQDRLRRQYACRIMQVRYYNQTRLRRDAAANLRGIDRPAVFFRAPKTFHVRF